MPDTPIERIARAGRDVWIEPYPRMQSWDDMSNAAKERWSGIARAIIAAAVKELDRAEG